MKTIYQAVVEFAEMFDGDVELRTDYSGRSMYGKTCVGLVTDFEPLSMMLDLGAWVAQECDLEATMVSDELSPRTDTMGKSTIIYFPYLQSEEE